MGDGGVGSGSVNCGCHQFSENICFVKCKTPKSGKMVILCELWVDFVGRVGLCG